MIVYFAPWPPIYFGHFKLASAPVRTMTSSSAAAAAAATVAVAVGVGDGDDVAAALQC